MMKKQSIHITLLLIAVASILPATKVSAQDPKVPSANLGLTNLQAGRSRPPGWYYIQYLQVYNPAASRGADGEKIAQAPNNSSATALLQLAYISPSEVLSGHIGYTALLAVQKVSPDSKTPVPVNPNPMGDLVLGPFIQWYDKQLFGLPFAHRFGLNVGLPTGAFDAAYAVNPGAHRYRIFPHYEFTITPVSRLSLSIKNNLYYYFREVGSPNKLGTAYNLNYALEFAVSKRLIVEAAGYYLTQLEQDGYEGDHHYYQDQYGIRDTRERVFGFGPGIGTSTAGGLSLELKAMWETAVVNRPEGIRSTIVLSYKL